MLVVGECWFEEYVVEVVIVCFVEGVFGDFGSSVDVFFVIGCCNGNEGVVLDFLCFDEFFFCDC